MIGDHSPTLSAFLVDMFPKKSERPEVHPQSHPEPARNKDLPFREFLGDH